VAGSLKVAPSQKQISTAPEELNICKILHAQRTQALHAIKVNRKKMVLQRNSQKREQFKLKYNFNNVQCGNSISAQRGTKNNVAAMRLGTVLIHLHFSTILLPQCG